MGKNWLYSSMRPLMEELKHYPPDAPVFVICEDKKERWVYRASTEEDGKVYLWAHYGPLPPLVEKV